jgi:hypothetical protein
MKIKWYQKAILSCLVALVFISNCGWLTLVSQKRIRCLFHTVICFGLIKDLNIEISVQISQLRVGRHPGNAEHHSLYIPHSLSLEDGQRVLSINLGGGACQWKPPVYDVPANIDFHKTVIAGYPSGDKRMVFIQMEALTGWRKLLLFAYLLVVTIQIFCTNNTGYFVQPPRMNGSFRIRGRECLIIPLSRQTIPITRVSGAGMMRLIRLLWWFGTFADRW